MALRVAGSVLLLGPGVLLVALPDDTPDRLVDFGGWWVVGAAVLAGVQLLALVAAWR